MFLRVLECVTYILAIYGLIILIYGIAESIRCRIKGRRPNVRVVLLVRDAEEYIEYIVRSAVKNEFAVKALSDKKLTIVDMDSADNTYLLLQKLQKSFPSIEIMKYDQFSDLFSL